MKKNPVIPYIVIFVFGIVLVFILSFKGLGDMKEVAKDNGEGKGGEKTEVAASNPEDIYKSTCIGCHGDQYQGVVGPALKNTGLSKDEVKDILNNGKGTGMPKGLVPAEQVDAMADWVSKIK
ncbi:cytochrome c [Neobacillus sp. MM2021_6]|uniref:cytochrome c550 n=1 Tax=Bacillaceae TaxID=186817 RepID=UPI00140C7AAE|nr:MULTISPECIES: cytochrome c [Bacillaceae]MBO0959471.1 cytochrome c [Neobacillus sp. MM2021_6]NHC17231.1 cytochrome c [Bacillus sp. MM2020_4]